MKALVTGGAGFIGSNIVELLLKKSYSVVVLDNFSTGYEENLRPFPQVKVIKGDIREIDALREAIKDCDIVFHLAASIGNLKSLRVPIEDAEVNIIGTLRLLEAARASKVKKIIYSSSAAIFGELQYMPIDEGHPFAPDSPYGVSKLAAEKYCLCYGKLYGFIVVCLRYFNVYGINQRYDEYGNVIPIFAKRLKNHEPLTIYGDGEQTRDFINARDVAKANLIAAEQASQSGIFNVGTGQTITINHLASIMQKVSGIKVPLNYDPPRKGEVRHCKADISAVQKVFDFKPSTHIEQDLKEYFEWFKKLPT